LRSGILASHALASMRVGRRGPAEGECPVPTGVECRRAEEEGGGVVVEVRKSKDSTPVLR